jgi:rod shape-determining protein MreD
MSGATWSRLFAVVVGALIVQICVLNEIVVFDAHPDVMILVAVAAGIVGGPVRGATFGFVSGLAADLAVNLPYGLSALTFVLTGFGAAYLAGVAAGRDFAGTHVTLVVVGALCGTLLYAIIGAIVGQPDMIGTHLLHVLVIVALGAFVLGLPTLRAARWVFEPSTRAAGGVVPRGGSATAV